MKTTKVLLGEKIKEIRKSRKLSQDELSEKIGIDPKHLSRIEVGRSFPSLDTLERIAKALGIDIKDLFEFMPYVKDKELTEGINRFIKEADSNQLRLIYKIVRAVVR